MLKIGLNFFNIVNITFSMMSKLSFIFNNISNLLMTYTFFRFCRRCVFVDGECQSHR